MHGQSNICMSSGLCIYMSECEYCGKNGHAGGSV